MNCHTSKHTFSYCQLFIEHTAIIFHLPSYFY